MGKKLSEMTLEELWELFPIILTCVMIDGQESFCPSNKTHRAW